MKVNEFDLLEIYEKEISVNTKNKDKLYRFERNKIENIYDIKYMIESGDYHIIKYNIFYISKPKYRIVMSLNIKDKLANHYVTRHILIPKLDKYLDIRNCATRKNMGYDYGIKLLKKYIEYHKKYKKFYILKIDISKYFYSIDHSILKGLLKDKLNKEEYDIVESIIDSTNKSYVNDVINGIKEKLFHKDIERRKEIEKIPVYKQGKGLPIGNMTSQFLSIFYLYKLDHYIVNDLKLKYMAHYMDDYVILSHDKNYLRKCLEKIKDILKNTYQLDINENKTKILDSYHGFEYLGYIFKVRDNKTIIRIKKENKKRRDHNMKEVNYLFRNNFISYSSFFCSIHNYLNSYKYAKSGNYKNFLD